MSAVFLDTRAEIERLDPQHALTSIEMLGSQVQAVWHAAAQIEFGDSLKNMKNVVVAGMGGSILGTHVIQTLFKDQLKVPVVIAPDYTVPSFVNEDTLVIASSYSGSTEETLAAVEDARQKNAQITGITSGGKLAAFFEKNALPALIFDTEFNPCASPRMGLGYSIFGQMAVFARAGLITITPEDFQEVMEVIARMHLSLSVHIPQEENPAKLLAFEMIDHVPVITVAEHLEGMAHVFANQLNENAKTFAEFRVIPEMNHHLLEGLQFPQNNFANFLFVTAQSKLYSVQNQRRIELTENIFEQNNLETRQIQLESTTKIGQAFEFLLIAAYSSFYLAMLNNQNPVPNPSVDWLKSELKKG